MMLRKYLQGNKLIVFGLLVISLSSCYKENDYYYSSSEILEHLTVEINDNSIPADGISSTKISYSFPVEVDPALTAVLLVASKGKFLESNNDSLTIHFVTLDASKENRVAEVTLISSTDIGDCIISATVQNYVKKDTLFFHKAYATGISLSSSTFFIKNDTITSILFEAKLTSNAGLASSGQMIFFESSPLYGIPSSGTGTSNYSGKANFEYIFTNTLYVGTMLFKAQAINEAGDTITATKSIQVID